MQGQRGKAGEGMNHLQNKQFRRVVGAAHRRPEVVQMWLRCRGLADHETRRRRGAAVVVIWRPYWGRVDGAALVALCELARAIGARLEMAEQPDDSGPVFLLTRFQR